MSLLPAPADYPGGPLLIGDPHDGEPEVMVVSDEQPDGGFDVYVMGRSATQDRAEARSAMVFKMIAGGRRALIRHRPSVDLSTDLVNETVLVTWRFRVRVWPEPGEWLDRAPTTDEPVFVGFGRLAG